MKSFSVTEKDARVKYIRALERFLGSCANALKNESFDLKLFEKRVEKSLKTLRKAEPVRLDSAYTNALHNYVELVLRTLNNEEDDAESKRKVLLKEVNLIEKERNRSSYKKDKHKEQGFNDGY
ncbi:MAG: hypothetical protein PHW07_02115 [Sulfurospirillaceae bacterium]|nr:hypothetical protein [Sulfurospirillaceae bacterium]